MRGRMAQRQVGSGRELELEGEQRHQLDDRLLESGFQKHPSVRLPAPEGEALTSILQMLTEASSGPASARGAPESRDSKQVIEHKCL